MNILVVDREADLAAALEILRKTPGNDIQSATTGDEAIALTQGKPVDLLITEVFMEPMNGFTLRNKMENRHLGVRTIFLTSYDLGPYKEHTEGYEVIAKPATPQKLIPAIVRAMAGGWPTKPTPAPSTLPQKETPPSAPEPAPAPAQAEAPAAPPEPEPELEPAPAPAPEPQAIEPTPQPEPAPTAPEPPAPTAGATPEPPPPAPERVAEVSPAPEPQPATKPEPEPATPAAETPAPEPAPAAEPVTPIPVIEAAAEAPAIPRPAAKTSVIPAPVPPLSEAPAPVAPKPTPVSEPKPEPKSEATTPPSATPPVKSLAPPTKSAPAPLKPAIGVKPSATPIAKPLPALKPSAHATPVVPAPAADTAPFPKPAPAAKPALGGRISGPSRSPGKVSGGDLLIGQQLGTYRIERRIGKGKWGPVYLANQTSMNRPVAMEMLDPEPGTEQDAHQNFVAAARAKAAVQHPHILSVYEAGELDGRNFFTHQYVDGLTLAQMFERGQLLTEQSALQTIKCVAQGLAHLHQHRISHTIPDSTDIYIGSDALPYLSNIAQPGDEMPSIPEEIAAIGEVVRAVLPGNDANEPGLSAMLKRMGLTNQMGFQTWPALFQAIQAIEPKVVPIDAFKLSAQDEAAIRAVEDTRRRQKRAVVLGIAAVVLFIAALGGGIWWLFLRSLSHDFSNQMVKVEQGEFVFGNGQKVFLPTYYIDKYEVTIAEYGQFIDYLQKNGNPTTFDSPSQPPSLSHVPRDWDIYFGRAGARFARYRTVSVGGGNGTVPISLDCPVFNVNYYDAYAYAKWKGRRLPTEQEWEKAARGVDGVLYPWGNAWDPAKANNGADYQAAPEADYKPPTDGFAWWSPVDAIQTDRSPYGVIGMAGNVSEWTSTWDPTNTQVIVKGGNFKSDKEGAKATAEIRVDPIRFQQALGFRTVSDTPPMQ